MTAIVEARNQLEMSSRYRIGTYSQMEMNGKLFLDLQTGKITQAEEAEQRVNSLSWPFPAAAYDLDTGRAESTYGGGSGKRYGEHLPDDERGYGAGGDLGGRYCAPVPSTSVL